MGRPKGALGKEAKSHPIIRKYWREQKQKETTFEEMDNKLKRQHV
jgi:hypothetical protein